MIASTAITLFGEEVEIRLSADAGAAVPMHLFFADGDAIADIAVWRRGDGLIQYNDPALFAAVETIRRRRSTGFKFFFLLTAPILWMFDAVFKILGGMGRVFGIMSMFGVFSLFVGFAGLILVLMTLGAMATVLIYAAPVFLIVFLARWFYRDASTASVQRLKEACRSLTDGSAMDADAASPSPPRLPSAAPQITKTAQPIPRWEQPTPPFIIKKGPALVLLGILALMGGGIYLWRDFKSQPASTASAEPSKPIAVPVKAPKEIAGTGTLLTTNRLTVQGRTITLAGLDAVPRTEAIAAAQNYLDQTGALNCRPAGKDWACRIVARNLDLAEVLARSGLATINDQADDALRRAETAARTAGKGVWGKD